MNFETEYPMKTERKKELNEQYIKHASVNFENAEAFKNSLKCCNLCDTPLQH